MVGLAVDNKCKEPRALYALLRTAKPMLFYAHQPFQAYFSSSFLVKGNFDLSFGRSKDQQIQFYVNHLTSFFFAQQRKDTSTSCLLVALATRRHLHFFQPYIYSQTGHVLVIVFQLVCSLVSQHLQRYTYCTKLKYFQRNI